VIVRQHALQIAAVVRQDMAGIRRVSVVRTDGRPFFDDPGDTPAGEDSDAVEAQLDHITGGKVKAAYDRAKRLQRRADLMAWHEDALIAARDGATVVELRRRKESS
jgi:hypothetical protein